MLGTGEMVARKERGEGVKRIAREVGVDSKRQALGEAPRSAAAGGPAARA